MSTGSSAGLPQRLVTWVAAGLIDASQAEAIRAHEARLRGAEPPQTAERRARIAEVVGYVGAAFAVGAVALLLAEVWDLIVPLGRLALTLLLTVALIATGALLVGRGTDPMRRLAAVLWLAAVAAAAWTAGVVMVDLLTVSQRWLGTLVALPALLVAAALLAAGRFVVLQLATLVALLVTAGTALSALSRLPIGSLVTGLLLLGAGVAWGVAGSGGWLGPRWSAETAGGVLALVGVSITRFGDAPRPSLAAGALLALALVGLSLPGRRVHLLFVGAAGLFIFVPQLVFELFADTLGAPATLLAAGLLLILLATGLGRVRRAQASDSDRVSTPEVSHG